MTLVFGVILCLKPDNDYKVINVDGVYFSFLCGSPSGKIVLM